MSGPRTSLSAALATLLLACGDTSSPGVVVTEGATLRVTLQGLPALDPLIGGRYQLWVVDATGTAAAVAAWSSSNAPAEFTNPQAGARSVELTWEPPGDADPAPSAHLILRGRFRGGAADLTVVGAVTQDGVEVHQAPGQFTMFSPSDNAEHGYPSFEESGVWLFNMAPRQLPQNDMWVRLAQLQPGWVYEGWMARDIGQAVATWLSYGKFRPDATGTVNSRDDTGWGPYSGVLNFRTAGEEEFPGDDWIANPLGFALPAVLTLPLNLRERDGQGAVRWTHVITIEPSSDGGEPVGSERPFVMRPYRDPFGDGGPGSARTITFRPEGVPSGRVALR